MLNAWYQLRGKIVLASAIVRRLFGCASDIVRMFFE